MTKHFHTRCVDAGEPVSSEGSCEPLRVQSSQAVSSTTVVAKQTVVASTTETTQSLEPVSEMPSDQKTEPAPTNKTRGHKLGEIRPNQPSSYNSDEITGLQEQVPSRDAASVLEEPIVVPGLITTEPSSNYSDSITGVQEKAPPTDSNGTLHDKKNTPLELFGAFFSAKRFGGNLDKNGTLKVPLLETKGPEVHNPGTPLLGQSPGVTVIVTTKPLASGINVDVSTGPQTPQEEQILDANCSSAEVGEENEGISNTGEMFMKSTIKNYMNDMLCHDIALVNYITYFILVLSFIFCIVGLYAII